MKIFSKINLDYFQIYGDISAKKIKEIKNKYKKIIMAIQVKEKKGCEKYKYYENVADIILLIAQG